VITGGAQGIGRCIVQSFTKNGAKVHFSDVNGEAGRRLQLSLGPTVAFTEADLSTESGVRLFTANVLKENDLVDVLVNNVCATGFGHCFANRPLAEWKVMLDLGLTSYFLCAQALNKALINANGCIVNIASTRALMSESDTDAYSAVKGGVVALTHSLAITLGAGKVRVNCISPGWIDVSGWQYPPRQEQLTERDHKQHPVGRVGRPEDIAEACMFLASRSSAGFITGQNLVVDGGMTKKMVYE
jgi:NAD(P)-dependent dehydrogenase (short-subunit alcohol dehydrogenase family)